MASSKVMACAASSAANPDLTPDSSTLLLHSLLGWNLELQSDYLQSGGSSSSSRSFGSMNNMDDLLKNMNIYAADYDSFPPSSSSSSAAPADLDACPVASKTKTVDEVWKEIMAGTGGTSREPEMTLEDFLTTAGAVREEEVRVPVMPPPPTGLGVESMMNGAQFAHMQASQNAPGGFGVDSVGYGNGIDGRMVPLGGSRSSVSCGVGRGKRKALEEPLDKATQQKQRRMIKNRESAARSRERKQAYTIELESLVTQLEEENARLLREDAMQSKERFKQLMENWIPVLEKRRPPRALRRVHSMSW